MVAALLDSGGLVINLIEFVTHFKQFGIKVALIVFGDFLSSPLEFMIRVFALSDSGDILVPNSLGLGRGSLP